MDEEKSDGAVLHDAIEGIMSEFMDEYIIIGKKAGRRQKMVVSTSKSENGFLSPMYERCIKWAYDKDEFKEDKNYE